MARRRKLNKRVVILLAAIGTLVGMLIIAAIIYRQPEDPVALAARGQKLMKAGNYAAAVANYRRAVASDRKPEYLLALGDARMKWRSTDRNLGQAQRVELFRGARRSYLEAIRLDPNFIEGHRRVAQMAYLMARYSTDDWVGYMRALDGLLGLVPDDHQALFRRAQAKARIARSRPDYEELALADFSQLLAAAPGKEEYWLALGAFQRQRKREDEAEKAYADALKAIPDSVRLRVALADLLHDRDRRGEALQLLQDAIARQPKEAEAYLAVASHYQRADNIDGAVKVLRDGIAAVPGNYRTYVRLAKVLSYYRKETVETEALLREGLKALAASGGPEKLEGDRLREYRAGVLGLNHELCDVLLDRLRTGAKGEDILPLVQEALEQMQDIDEDHAHVAKIRGRVALAHGKPVEAEQLLRSAYERYSGFEPKTATLLINLYRRMGQLGEAQKIIERFLGYSRESPGALLALVRLNLDYRKYDQAQRVLDEVLKKAPENKEAKDLKLVLDVLTGKTNRIPAGLERVNSYAARLFRAQAVRLWLEGQQAAAIQLLRDVLRLRPNAANAAIQLIKWHKQRNETKAIEALYQDATRIFKNDQATLQRLALAMETDPKSRLAYQVALARRDSDPVRRAIRLARVYGRAGEQKEYEASLKEAQSLAPNHPAVVEELFLQALRKADWDAAQKHCDASADANLDKVGGRMYRARLAKARGQWDEAIRLTLESLRVRPRFSQAYAFLGDCNVSARRYDDAREAYETAYSQNPSNVRALLGLVAVSEATGKAGDYAHWIELAYKFQPDNPAIRERWLQRRQGRDSPKKMIRHREQIAALHPADLVNLGHLAVLYERVGNLPGAERIYVHMVRVSKGALQPVRLLVNLLRRMDRDAEARSFLARYADSARDKVGAYLLWGSYLESAGEIQQAEAAYLKALETGPGDGRGCVNLARFNGRRGRWAKSVKYQKQYIEKFGEKAYPGAERDLIKYLIRAEQFEEVQARAARTLEKDPSDVVTMTLQGLAWLQQGDYVRAKEVLDHCLAINPGYSEALMYRARVHLANGRMALAKDDLEDARRANAPATITLELAKVYENMGDFGSAYAVLQSLLADRPGYGLALEALVLLCQRHERWDQLSEILLQARKAYPRNLFYLVAEAEMYIEQNQPQRAEQLLAEAKKVLPETAPISVLQMRAMVHGGRHDVALNLGRDLRTHREVGPSVLAICGRAYAEKKNDAQAEQEFRAALKGARSGRQLAFVVGQIELAYGSKLAGEKLKRWVSSKPEDWELRLLIGTLLVKEKDFKAAEEHLKKGLELASSDGERFQLLRQLGLAYYDTKDFAKSRDNYQAALKLRPKDQIVLNNLAWLLVNELKKPDEAIRLVRRALDLEPYNPHTLDTYGVVLMAKGQLGQARDVLNRSADIKELPANRLHLGQVFEKMGRKQDALREYTRGWARVKNMPEDRDYAALRDALKRFGEEPAGRTGT